MCLLIAAGPFHDANVQNVTTFAANVDMENAEHSESSVS